MSQELLNRAEKLAWRCELLLGASALILLASSAALYVTWRHCP
jgi:hypothetical protein